MSAETLRQAASLMRERAEAAADSPWLAREEVAKLPGMPEHTYVRWSVYATDTFDKGNAPYVAEPNGRPDAEHIASWHPAVALAVADWLDSEADAYDTCLAKQADPERRFQSLWTATANARHDHALTVARAYLGEAS